MQRSHYLIITLAILAIAGLYLMPRSVIQTKERTMDTTEETEQHSEDDGHDHAEEPDQMHAQTLTKEQAEAMSENRTAFLEASEEIEKIKAYNKFAKQLRDFAQFDSLAFFANELHQNYPSENTLEIAGDAHYEAFGFAMNKNKKADLAQKARSFYEKMENISPETKVKMGVTYVTTTAPMQGIGMIREVLNENPENQFALFNLGNLSMQSGQFDKAVERFEKLVSINSEDLEAQLRLAECYLQLNKKEQAIPKLEYVLANTDDEIRKDGLKKLLIELKK